MATSQGEPNPLRPYYIPPSIGIPQDTPGATSSGTHGLGPRNGSAASYASSAREMFSDIDYSDYMSDGSPSTFESIRKTLDEALYRYVSVLLSQPFDVAKTILQVRLQDGDEEAGVIPGIRDGAYGRFGTRSVHDNYYVPNSDDDSDPDEPDYFTSTTPSSSSFRSTRRLRELEQQAIANGHRDPSPPPGPSKPAYYLTLKKSDSIMEGVFSALFNVPDAGVIGGLGAVTEVADSPYPWASLVVAVTAFAFPQNVRLPNTFRLVLTPISHPKRSLIHNLRILPSYFCPNSLMLPTVLHSLITPTINHSMPLLLRTHLAIDPVLTPTTYSIFKFFARTAELFLKLPLETVLRRGQMSILTSKLYRFQTDDVFEPVIPIGPYRGTMGTMWSIVKEEGTSSRIIRVGSTKKTKTVERKGQGIEGLWRGWRVGMWGLVGVWGARAMGGGGSTGGEF
ncbi:fusion and transport ugo1 [Hyphodiscus hymeniophilus]|uniref:Fusion and transport ugo1 n=1 Tax=Hyphodiscus hymeniophilus TaxID=353542 RepID=A0A9P6VEZ9_9HELO|nr:fusion and transport ugo1 [Hyphodiscus hymeniophilus]